MYNQCIYFTPKKHQTNIYYMKHTKIYQATCRIQRTFITTTFHVFLGLSEHGKLQEYVNTRQMIIPVQKIIRNPAALIKDSILWIKTTTKKSQKLEFNEY